MTQLTEREIIDCLRTNLRGAADDCEALVRLPAQGPTFMRLRDRLKLVEGACRQMTYWREDTRWLPVGMMMEAVHQKSRQWIVGHQPRKLFGMLAERLRMLHAAAEMLETRATGRSGAILPPVVPGPHRDNRPVQVKTPGGIMLPPGYVNGGF